MPRLECFVETTTTYIIKFNDTCADEFTCERIHFLFYIVKWDSRVQYNVSIKRIKNIDIADWFEIRDRSNFKYLSTEIMWTNISLAVKGSE